MNKKDFILTFVLLIIWIGLITTIKVADTSSLLGTKIMKAEIY